MGRKNLIIISLLILAAFSSALVSGLVMNPNYSEGISNLETRPVASVKTITVTTPQHDSRDYILVPSLNVTTNFDASCKYSTDSGITNFSLSSTNNRDFGASVSLGLGDYVIDFYCSDNSSTTSAQSVFSIVDHLVWYVDNSSASCTDVNNRNYATSKSTPFCTILSAMKNVRAGDEVVILNSTHTYCEPIDPQGISGTAGSPIIVRGESDSQRIVLNGSCYPKTSNAIQIAGEDFYTFRYFYITNFSSDALNIHAIGTDNSLNITFENITTYREGYLGQGVLGGAYGDGVSFHENCTGVTRNVDFIENWKSGIVDVNGAQTDYYDIFITGSEDYGVYFLSSGYSNSIGKHYLENIFVNDSNMYCLASDVNVTAVNYTCVGNSGNHQLYLGAPFVNITNFNISQTSAPYSSVYIYGGGNVYLTNGKMDRGLLLTGNSNLIALNVSYPAEIVSSSILTRKWYYDLTVKSGGVALPQANVSIYNANDGSLLYNGLTDSDGKISSQALIGYENNGTATNVYNYIVNVSKKGYSSGSSQFNITSDNLAQTINLLPVSSDANNILLSRKNAMAEKI